MMMDITCARDKTSTDCLKSLWNCLSLKVSYKKMVDMADGDLFLRRCKGLPELLLNVDAIISCSRNNFENRVFDRHAA